MSPLPNATISSKDLNKDAIEQQTDTPKQGSDLQDVDFYSPHDGTKGRPGGVYLDMQERVDAEERRAKAESRKPDYDNPPAVAGTPLVTESQRFNNDFANGMATAVAPVKQVDPVSTLPVDFGTAEVEEEVIKEPTEPAPKTETTVAV